MSLNCSWGLLFTLSGLCLLLTLIAIKSTFKNIAYSAPKPRVAYTVHYLEIKKTPMVAVILLASTTSNNSVCSVIMKIDMNSLFNTQIGKTNSTNE